MESENNLVDKRSLDLLFLERITGYYWLPISLNYTLVIEIHTLSHIDTVQIFTSQGQKIAAKYVIITIPLGRLKQCTMTFQPSLLIN
jgi:hypothetical protein